MSKKQFDDLFDEAQALSEAGDSDGSLAKYLAALGLEPENPNVLYKARVARSWNKDRR